MDVESSALCAFWARSLRDSIPPRPFVLYLFVELPKNEKEVLDRGAECALSGGADFVCIPEQFGRGGLPYAEPWRAGLVERGVPRERILAVEVKADPGEGEPSTLTESKALLRECVRRGWRNVGVTAAAFHQARAFLTVISEAIRTRPDLNVYSIPAEPGDWDTIVTLTDGTRDTRVGMIRHENARIARYSNLVSPSQGLAYLSARGLDGSSAGV